MSFSTVVSLTKNTQIEAVKAGIKNGKFNLSEAGDINTFARQKGVRVVYYASEDAGNHGAILADGKTIAINTLSDVSKYSTIAHEYIHSVYTNNRSEYVKLVEDIRALRKTDNEFNALVERVTHDVENAYKNEYVDSRVITRARLIEQEVTARLVEELLFDRKNASSSATKSGKGIARLLGLSDEGVLTRLKKFFTHLRNRLKGTSMSSEVQTVDDLISEIEELIAKGKIKKSTKSQTAIDNGGSLLYSKKSYYTQWRSDALAWANKASTEVGDRNVGYDSKYAYLYEATDPDGEGKSTDFVVLRRESRKNITGIDDLIWRANGNEDRINAENGRENNRVYQSAEKDPDSRRVARGSRFNVLEQRAGNGRDDGVSRGASERDGSGRTQSSDRYSPEVRPATDRRGLNQDSDNVRKSKDTFKEGTQNNSYAMSWARATMRVEGEKTIIGNKVIVADDTDIGYHIIKDVSRYSRNKIGFVQEEINAENEHIRTNRENTGASVVSERTANGYRNDFRGSDDTGTVGQRRGRVLRQDGSQESGENAGVREEVSGRDGRGSNQGSASDIRSDKVRRSIDSDGDIIANYTEAQYNKYGWARVNGVLNKAQNADFNAKFRSPAKYILENRTSNRELIIPVSDSSSENYGVNNVLVFVKGSFQNPTITKIIKIDLDNETDVDVIRRIFYDQRYSDRAIAIAQHYFGYGLINEFGREDYGDYWTHRRRASQRSNSWQNEGDNQIEFDGRGNDRETRNTQKRSSDDIRRSLDKDDDVKGNYTVGQRAKFVANNTQMKVYSRADAEAVISTILSERLSFDDGKYATLAGKDKKTVVDYLFRKLNTAKEGYRSKVALDIADYLIDNVTLGDMYAEETVSDSMHKLANQISSIE